MVDETVERYDLHLRRRGLATPSRVKFCASIERFIESFPRWTQVTTRQLEQWLDALPGRGRPELGPRTRYWWVSTLHTFYDWALDEGLVEADPTRRAVRPKLPELAARPLGAHDVAMILELTPPGPTRTAIVLMVHAGLRCCEVSRLRWRDVDETARRLRITGKGNRVRWVDIGPRLAVVLPERSRPLDPVIGAHWPPGRVSQAVGDQLRRCGVDASAHQLRHTLATDLYDATGDLPVVQAVLGHASIATTKIYVRVPDRRVTEAMQLVG